ncbi:MAG: hypothetical protein J6R37_01390 [Clostridia bacterium]|nr:hypothetical protein [Clostridia bacterium]
MKEHKSKTKNNHLDTDEKRNDEHKRTKKNLWPLWVFILSLCLSFIFNLVSELMLRDTNAIWAYLLTLLIMFVGIIFDVVGTAATSCDAQPLHAMASRKVYGAKKAVVLAKNADKVASVCCDIIGDVCGIVSGVCGAAIVAILQVESSLFLSILVYALISTMTISGKAIGKNFGIEKSTSILLFVGKILSIFEKKK